LPSTGRDWPGLARTALPLQHRRRLEAQWNGGRYAWARSIVALAWTLLLQARMLMLVRHGLGYAELAPLHFAALMMLGYFYAPYTANTVMGRITYLW